jgi:hypothetical protein
MRHELTARELDLAEAAKGNGHECYAVRMEAPLYTSDVHLYTPFACKRCHEAGSSLMLGSDETVKMDGTPYDRRICRFHLQKAVQRVKKAS